MNEFHRRKPTVFQWISALLFGIALTGCGGGGGDNGSNSMPPPPPAPATLSVIAGTDGGASTSDGMGTAARFNTPVGIAADAGGNLYVTEPSGYTVRKITPAGIVTTLAGSPGVFGYVNATGAAAQFSDPGGVQSDAAGNVYVLDEFSVRMITPAGVVTTFAGGVGFNMSGTMDGVGTAARFTSPGALAIDGGGNLYVLDGQTPPVIRKVTPAAVVTTIGPVPGAQGGAAGIAADAAGNLYISNTADHTVRVVHPDGSTAILAGAPGNTQTVDGTGAAAGFAHPTGIAVGAGGNLYVTDSADNVVRKVTPSGVVTTIAGTAGASGNADGSGASARFNSPNGVAADALGNLYIADTGNSTVRKIDASGAVTTLAGKAPSIGSADGAGAAAQFNEARGIDADAGGNLYVADHRNGTIRRITPGGVVSTLAGSAGKIAFPPSTLPVDGAGAAATFCGPEGVAAAASGTIFMSDFCGLIRRVDTSSGNVTTIAGHPVSGAVSADGTGAAATFADPLGIAMDAMGNLYATDVFFPNFTAAQAIMRVSTGGTIAAGSSIRKIVPGGVVSTLAGAPTAVGFANGTGVAALFNNTVGVAVDAQDNAYVADKLNCAIRKVTPAGVVTTFAGVPAALGGTCNSVDGAAAVAQFTGPIGIAIDSVGNFYVVDGGSAIRKIATDGTVSIIWGAGRKPGLALTALPNTYFPAYGVAVINDQTLAITTTTNVLKLTLPQ